MSDATVGRAQLERAGTLCDMRRFADAEALLHQLIASDPSSHGAMCLLARAELGSGKSAPALASASRAIVLAPEEEWSHRLASIAAGRLGRHKDAERHAQEAVRLAPHEWRTHVRLAGALVQTQTNLRGAVDASKRAVALAPNEPDAHAAVGMVAAAIGDNATAEEAYRHVLALDPQSTVAHNELARVQLRKSGRANAGGLAAAATGFAAALGADPTAEVSRRNLEIVLRGFLQRAAYFLFIAAFLSAHLVDISDRTASRVLPLILLAVPLAFVARFVTQLDRRLRTHLRNQLLRRSPLQIPAALETIAAFGMLASAVLPQSSRLLVAVLAAVVAAIGRFVLWSDAR